MIKTKKKVENGKIKIKKKEKEREMGTFMIYVKFHSWSNTETRVGALKLKKCNSPFLIMATTLHRFRPHYYKN